MKRRSLTDLQRYKIFEANQGFCHLCQLVIQIGEKWEVEHIIPLAMGGADEGANLAPAHKHCHAPKTVKDARDIAKVKRIAAKHVGAKQSRWPMGKFKRKVSGETVLR
jgi:5-methylcytosine-specific restriction endonuclease McrA